MKIYTRTGDDGTTGLYGGRRVSKADLRVDAYGTVDEANASVGLARAAGLPPPVEEVLARVQAHLFQLGASLATPQKAAAASRPGGSPAQAPVSEEEILGLERAIDALETGLAPLRTFVLPGGTEGACRLHLARTVCRRAERLVVALAAREEVHESVVRYLNRLSDLLFVQARATNHAAGVADVPWKGGA